MKPKTAAVVEAAEHDYETHRVALIFDGSDGDATRALYDELAGRAWRSAKTAAAGPPGVGYGPIGLVAVNLFRAQKCVARTQRYAQGHYAPLAYGRKNWALDQLVAVLLGLGGATVGLRVGWRPDATNERYPWGFYVDLPQGPVRFQALARGEGPDYFGPWDGNVQASTGRILKYVNQVLRPPRRPTRGRSVRNLRPFNRPPRRA